MTTEGSPHPTAADLLSYTEDGLGRRAAAALQSHLDGCLACRVWAGRLRHAAVAVPDAPDEVIARLVAAAQAVPAGLADAITAGTGRDDPAAAGELWRVGRDEALLVWVRRVLDGAVAVIPVVLDTDLADEHTLLVPAASSPVAMDLAVMASVDAHIDPRAFRQRLGKIDCADDIERICGARRSGSNAEGVAVGPPVTSHQDQRLEYRQMLSDLLGDLAPDAYATAAADDDDGAQLLAIHRELRDLATRRRDVAVRAVELLAVDVDDEHLLVAVAAVDELDKTVLVAELTGPRAATLLTSPDTAQACGALQQQFMVADAVAAAVAGAEWAAVVVAAPFAHDGIEPPGGGVEGPRVETEPLRLADALFKHLDAHSISWDEDGAVELRQSGTVDVAGVVAVQASAAIAAAQRAAAAFRLPEKRAGYAALDTAAAGRIEACVQAVLDGRPVTAAIDALLSGEAP